MAKYELITSGAAVRDVALREELFNAIEALWPDAEIAMSGGYETRSLEIPRVVILPATTLTITGGIKPSAASLIRACKHWPTDTHFDAHARARQRPLTPKVSRILNLHGRR